MSRHNQLFRTALIYSFCLALPYWLQFSAPFAAWYTIRPIGRSRALK